MDQVQHLRETVPNPRACYRECTVLLSHCIYIRDHQNPLLSGANGSATCGSATMADRDLLGKLVQGQVCTARL